MQSRMENGERTTSGCVKCISSSSRWKFYVYWASSNIHKVHICHYTWKLLHAAGKTSFFCIFLEWKNISQSTSGSLQCNLWDYLSFSECNKVTKMWTHFRHIHFAHNHNPHPSHPAKSQHKVWKLILQKVMYGQYCRCLEKGLRNRFILSKEFARGRKHNFIAFLFAHISHESETTTTRGFCYLTQSAAVFT